VISRNRVPRTRIFHHVSLVAGNVSISIATYVPRVARGCYPKWKIKSHAQHWRVWRAASYISLRSTQRATWPPSLFAASLAERRFAGRFTGPECGMNCSPLKATCFSFSRTARSSGKLKTAYCGRIFGSARFNANHLSDVLRQESRVESRSPGCIAGCRSRRDNPTASVLA